MGLLNLQTDLKSLKFGNDRPGGGNSGQPFIQSPIPTSQSSTLGLGTDALIRGGILAPQRALKDVERLTRYLFNPKSPSGLLFTLKENLLSRTANKTEASTGIAYAGGALNAGVYSPLSTLAQAGVVGIGGHLNQKGIDPTGLIGPLSINKYEDVIKINEKSNNGRLYRLYELISSNSTGKQTFSSGIILNTQDSIMEYGGGPGSILGVGKTRIRFADQRTGKQNPQLKNFYNDGFVTFKNPRESDIDFNTKNLLKGITLNSIYDIGDIGVNIGNAEKSILKFIPSSTPSGSIYEESKASLVQTPTTPKSNNITISQPNGKDTYVVAVDKKYQNSSTFLNKTRIENRINLGDPGATKGTWAAEIKDYKSGITDKINGSKIYSTNSSSGKKHGDYNDLVSFRIAVINPNIPDNNKYTYMNFRSYIDSFSDSYSSGWKSQTYMGRGEKFYKYQDFDRSISMAFTVVAQSQGEMNGMYQKLNFLASSLAPTYTTEGYMAGNLVKMTVGDYIYEQIGFISSITYDIPQESSWELSLTPGIGIAGKDVKPSPNPDELPFMIKVTGLKFTPIHDFRPEIQYEPETGVGKRFITNQLPFTPKHNNY